MAIIPPSAERLNIAGLIKLQFKKREIKIRLKKLNIIPICELKIRAISKTEKLKGIKRDGTSKTLFTKIINLDEMLTWDEGRFLIECIPTGAIKIGCCDDSVLPSSASFFANVESETVSGIELYLDSGITWN